MAKFTYKKPKSVKVSKLKSPKFGKLKGGKMKKPGKIPRAVPRLTGVRTRFGRTMG